MIPQAPGPKLCKISSLFRGKCHTVGEIICLLWRPGVPLLFNKSHSFLRKHPPSPCTDSPQGVSLNMQRSSMKSFIKDYVGWGRLRRSWRRSEVEMLTVLRKKRICPIQGRVQHQRPSSSVWLEEPHRRQEPGDGQGPAEVQMEQASMAEHPMIHVSQSLWVSWGFLSLFKILSFQFYFLFYFW